MKLSKNSSEIKAETNGKRTGSGGTKCNFLLKTTKKLDNNRLLPLARRGQTT